jgi:3-hydroxybutyryl-CoA dehydrogenase
MPTTASSERNAVSYRIVKGGESRSFPGDHAFVQAAGARVSVARGDVAADSPAGSASASGVAFIGADAGSLYVAAAGRLGSASFVLVELGTECLGVHIGDDDYPTNVLGFARFRLGDAEPTALVELVRKPQTSEAALEAARDVLAAAGLVVAVCQDFPGRILDRLLRPYYNAALRRLDEGLASAADMDATLRMGLGYPKGPIELLRETGLHHHFEVTRALHEQLGQEPYAPARRARNAWLRKAGGGGQ